MKTKLTENARRHIGETLTIRWGTSRGRDSYGYTTCSLRNHRGQRVAACNGGGYDMRGTVIGNWIAATFPKELCALKPKDMEPQSHWEPERARECDGKCKEEAEKVSMASLTDNPESYVAPQLSKLPEDCFECPTCKGPTRPSREGKRINDGRSFYGLRFYDPNYDPGKAIIGTDCPDSTFGKPGEWSGKTVEEAEKAGVTVGLERLRAFYKQTSPHATSRHTVPTIDGACGESSVLKILKAIGLTLRKVADTSKLDVYLIEQAQ